MMRELGMRALLNDVWKLPRWHGGWSITKPRADPREALKKTDGVFENCDPEIKNLILLAHGVGPVSPLSNTDYSILSAAFQGDATQAASLAQGVLKTLSSVSRKQRNAVRTGNHYQRKLLELLIIKEDAYRAIANNPNQLVEAIKRLAAVNAYRPGAGYFRTL
jgi:hypothetical protein